MIWYEDDRTALYGSTTYLLSAAMSAQVTDGFRLSSRRLEYESHNPGKDKMREEIVLGVEEGLKHIRMLIKRQDVYEMRWKMRQTGMLENAYNSSR